MSLKPKYLFPLKFHISTIFLSMILLSCLAIAGLFYTNTIKMVNADADKLLAEINSELVTEFETVMGPPAVAVALASKHPLVEKKHLSERLVYVTFLMEAMNVSRELTSIYYGYPNGDFFMLRRLLTQKDRDSIGAPPNASWAIQSIDYEAGDPVSRKYIYLGSENEPLSSKKWATDYDPRNRPWYMQALDTTRTVRSSPYVFYTDQKIGMTFSRSDISTKVVIGADLRLETLSSLIQKRKVTPSTEAVLFDTKGRLIAYLDTSKLISSASKIVDDPILGNLSELGLPVLDKLFGIWKEKGRSNTGRLIMDSDSGKWVGSVVTLDLKSGPPMHLGLLIPYNELMADVRRIMKKTILVAVGIVLFLIPLTIMFARRIAGPVNSLAEDAIHVSHFDFTEKERVRTSVKEVHDLAEAMDLMKKTISKFLELIGTLNREKNFDSLLERISMEALKSAAASGVCVYLRDDDNETLSAGFYCTKAECVSPVPLPDLVLEEDTPMTKALRQKQVTPFHVTRENSYGMTFLLEGHGSEVTIWNIPLLDRENTAMGIIGLIYPGRPDEEPVKEFEARISFVIRLCRLAGITLETKQLIKKQKELFDAFIKLIANAIDSKSPYTGGHCQRVPVITKMIAQAACEAKEGPFKDFSLTEEEWEELHVAAWLHDCGKVTTPEFVVDKATKLETIYDRIHEVRMRFEVLSRDAEIAGWKKIAEGEDAEDVFAELDERRRQLNEDFSFVGTCNLGGEFLSDDAIERLRRIGDMEWQRTFDDRIGISWEEGKRKSSIPLVDLPAPEKLLSNKEEHLFIRTEKDQIAKDNTWGFKLDVPEYLYNRGELYNLEVKRGTLSGEERFKINDHIVQSIKMLTQLPYPMHLRNVPEIAGGHHETTIGTGYPRELTADQMSTTAKMMVIADVFEALTASDRPYKKAKTLGEAIKIMGFMHKDGHFDPDLYDLFLSSGVYRKYADDYLNKEQLDTTDE